LSRAIGRLPRVAEGALVRVARPPFDVLVTRVGGCLYAIEDACPHSGRSLSEGRLEGHVVTCAGHGWEIDVRTGGVLTAVGRGEQNPVFRAADEDGVVVLYED
jgi:nitrite reductase/ring-hydroxylating ferredoxin subunit